MLIRYTVFSVAIPVTTPHAPYNLTVTTDWFSARISWIPAYNGGNDQFFVIW